MSKDLNNNERYLKERADTFKPVPPPLVWDEIEQVLDKDKRKKRLFPILWIFGILVLGAIMLYNLSEKKDKESPIVDQEIIINDYQKQSDPNPQDIRSVDLKTISEVRQGQNANFLETKRTASDSQEAEAINEVKQNANYSETILKVSDYQEGNEVASEKRKSLVTQQPQLSNLNTADVFRSFNTNTINSNSTTIISNEDTFGPRMTTQSILEDRNIIAATPLQRLKSRLTLLVSKKPLSDPSENFKVIPIPESKSNPLLSSPWFLELGGGIGRNLSNPMLINPEQGEFRLNTESNWYSWSTSFQLGYQFNNLWYTTVGFDLNQTKNKFDFWRRDISSLKVSDNQIFQITNSDFFNIGEIRYTFADIGLSFGRRVNINDKWHFSLEGGAIFNLLFNANGKVQVGGLEFSQLENQQEYFKPQIGFGARLSAMLDYPISDQLWISVGPSYHKYLNTLSLIENPLKERNSILQVKAKLRYQF